LVHSCRTSGSSCTRWSPSSTVKAAVKIPVIANGNIQYMADVENCIRQTGVDGVMTAEGNLTNPALFARLNPTIWDISLEYLELAEQFPCPLSYIRGHLFKILHHIFQIRGNSDLREIIAKGHSIEEFRTAVNGVKERYLKYHLNEETFIEPEELKMFNLKHPPWRCQPYVRPPPEVYLEKMRKIAEEERKGRAESKLEENKRSVSENEKEDLPLSKSKRKKLEKKEQKEKWKILNQQKTDYQSCHSPDCNNPCSQKCAKLLCRKCCREKAKTEPLVCEVHKVYKRLFGERDEDRENLKQET